MSKRIGGLVLAALIALMGLMPAMAGAAGVMSPMRESTAEEILGETGVAMVAPEGADAVMYFLLDVDGQATGEMDFWLEDVVYTFRAAPGTEMPGLAMSGLYYEGMDRMDAEIFGMPAQLYMLEGGPGACLWFDGGRGMAFSLTADRVMDPVVLLERATWQAAQLG